MRKQTWVVMKGQTAVCTINNTNEANAFCELMNTLYDERFWIQETESLDYNTFIEQWNQGYRWWLVVKRGKNFTCKNIPHPMADRDITEYCVDVWAISEEIAMAEGMGILTE